MSPWPLAPLALLSFAASGAGAGPSGVCVVLSEHKDRFAEAAHGIETALHTPATQLDAGRVNAGQCSRLAIALGRPALEAVTAALPSVPVVFALVPNPSAVDRPGVAGVAIDPDPSKVLSILSELAPGARRVGAVYDPRQSGALVQLATRAAEARGLTLVPLSVDSLGDAVRAFRRFEHEIDIDALWLLPDATTTTSETVYYALQLADWRRIPVIAPSRWYVAQGALFALAPRYEMQGRVAGALAADWLAGKQPARLTYAPEQDLIVSARSAERLGLRVPRSLIERAAEVLP